MNLPSPAFTFIIPSVYDKTRLECRIYIPRELKRQEYASKWHRKGAIIAHPYAPLGGCYDDPVVDFVGEEFLQAGYIVGTFNFRGAGDSDGRTSWTAKPELADYVSFYCFVLYFLQILKRDISPAKEQKPDGDDSSPDEFKTEAEDTPTGVEIVLGGYSFGSLIASHLPTADVIMRLFGEVPVGSALFEICSIAEEISARSREKIRRRAGAGSPTSHDPDSYSDHGDGIDNIERIHIEVARMVTPSISYLLVSPLLPPISKLLTVFSTLSLNIGKETAAQGEHISCPEPTRQLCAHPTLVIYGNKDAFTSAKKLQKWSDELARISRNKFQYREFDEASHFWREDGVEKQARNVLGNWLHRTL